MSSDAVAIRDWVLLVHLSIALSTIASKLRDYDRIGIDDSQGELGDVFRDRPLSAELAIKSVRELLDALYRCDILANDISITELKRKVLTIIAMANEAIGQANVPAEIAFADGYKEAAIEICRRAFQSALELTSPEIHRIGPECQIEAQLRFPDGLKTGEIIQSFGFDPFSKRNLGTISTYHLSGLLKRINRADKGETPKADSPQFRSADLPSIPMDQAGDFIGLSEIKAHHLPPGRRPSDKQLTKYLDHNRTAIRQGRPIGPNGKPSRNRRRVHLGDWAKNKAQFVEWMQLAVRNRVGPTAKEHSQIQKTAEQIRRFKKP